MNPVTNIALAAARAAGKIILQYSTRVDSLSVRAKQRNDYVSEVDQMAEAEIIGIIRRAHPDHAILAEESGGSGESEYEWIIDPLDGTTNYLHGIPHYAVSIAFHHNGAYQTGVIYDPFKEELFCAERGRGATLNSRRIRVTQISGLSGALLGTGIPFRGNQSLDNYLISLRALSQDTAGIRRAGAAALDLAYIAAGRLDAFWEFGLKPWDMAAGVALIREAGGLVGDLAGGSDYMRTGNIMTANRHVFVEMVKRLHPHLSEIMGASAKV